MLLRLERSRVERGHRVVEESCSVDVVYFFIRGFDTMPFRSIFSHT